jgi:hypothetical protein
MRKGARWGVRGDKGASGLCQRDLGLHGLPMTLFPVTLFPGTLPSHEAVLLLFDRLDIQPRTHYSWD